MDECTGCAHSAAGPDGMEPAEMALLPRIAYEKMAEIPEELYGQNIKSNYQGQGLKLSKHFK